MSNENKKIIVVLGMHRSGTSLVTNALSTIGVDIGKDFIEKAEDNVKGFWENRQLNNINIRFLHAYGIEWDSVELIKLDPYQAKVGNLVVEALTVLRNLTASSLVFGFKDPRVSILLPVWNRIFSELNLTPYYIICFRNPLSVIESLSKRNQFAAIKSELLWLKYNLECIIGTSDYNRIFINYDKLIDSPRSELDKLSTFVLGNADDYKGDSFAEIGIDTRLRHATYTYEDFVNSKLLKISKNLFEILSTNKIGGLDTETLNDFAVKCLDQYAEINSVLQYIDKLEVGTAHLKNEIVKLHMEYLEKERLYNLVLNSSSWRITTPLRLFGRLVRKIIGKAD